MLHLESAAPEGLTGEIPTETGRRLSESLSLPRRGNGREGVHASSVDCIDLRIAWAAPIAARFANNHWGPSLWVGALPTHAVTPSQEAWRP